MPKKNKCKSVSIKKKKQVNNFKQYKRLNRIQTLILFRTPNCLKPKCQKRFWSMFYHFKLYVCQFANLTLK